VQAVLALAVIAVIVVLVRRTRSGDLVLALVALGTFAASPYTLTYDLPVVALAIARLAVRDRSWSLGEACIYGSVWALPLAAAPLAIAELPIAAPLLVTALAAICARSWASAARAPAGSLAAAAPAAKMWP
jgi:hypothetical protein